MCMLFRGVASNYFKPCIYQTFCPVLAYWIMDMNHKVHARYCNLDCTWLENQDELELKLENKGLWATTEGTQNKHLYIGSLELTDKILVLYRKKIETYVLQKGPELPLLGNFKLCKINQKDQSCHCQAIPSCWIWMWGGCGSFHW